MSNAWATWDTKGSKTCCRVRMSWAVAEALSWENATTAVMNYPLRRLFLFGSAVARIRMSRALATVEIQGPSFEGPSPFMSLCKQTIESVWCCLQFLAYLESSGADIEMRKFTPTKSKESRPSVSSRPLTPTGFAVIDGQTVPVFASEPQPAATIISTAASMPAFPLFPTQPPPPPLPLPAHSQGNCCC